VVYFPARFLRSRRTFVRRLITFSYCIASFIAAGALAPRALAKTTLDFIAGKSLLFPLPPNADAEFFVPGDINGDGRKDFVALVGLTDPVTGATTSEIDSFINHGGGNFTRVVGLPGHLQAPQALVDVNGDGMADLICTFLYDDPNQFRVFLVDVEVSFGRGDGTFAAPQKYTLQGLRPTLKAADINGYGKMDLVLAVNSIYYPLINQGDGTFRNGASYTATTGNGFTLADVNGDGRSDLLIPETNQLTIAFGTTTGGFGGTKPLPTRSYSFPPAVGDINGDHVMDIVVPTKEGVDVFIGDGGGDFHPGTPVNGGPAYSVFLADLNHNGTLDLLISMTSTNLFTQSNMHRISLYPGKGDGTFAPPRMYNANAGFLGVFDVTGSPAPDVVLTDLSVLPGDGYGSLLAAPITRAPGALGIVTGDFNRDGIPDVVVPNVPDCFCGTETTLTFFAGTGSGWLAAPKVYHTGITEAGSQAEMVLSAGDLNNDGKLDVVMTGGDSPVVAVLLGNGDGSFQAPRDIDLDGQGGTEIYIADINNDGKMDLIGDTGVLLGNGDGTFGVLIAFPSFPLHGIFSVGVADLNGDGKLDIAAGIDESTGPYTNDVYSIAILLGDGTGHFTKSDQWSIAGLPFRIVPAKMQSTGKLPDLVVVASGLTIFSNDGHGNFPHTFFPPYSFGGDLVVADFNGDGLNDVAAVNGDLLIVVAGKGDGTLDAPPFPPYPHSFLALRGPIAAADLNHDGALDIVTGSPLGVSRYINAAIPAP
jgi:hypothetical protein